MTCSYHLFVAVLAIILNKNTHLALKFQMSSVSLIFGVSSY